MKINKLKEGKEKVLGVTYDPAYREQRENFHTIMKSIDTTGLTIVEIYNEVKKKSLIPKSINVLRCYINYHNLPYKKKGKKIISVQTNSVVNKFIACMNSIHISNKLISTGLLIKELKISRQRIHQIFKSYESLWLKKNELNNKLLENRKKQYAELLKKNYDFKGCNSQLKHTELANIFKDFRIKYNAKDISIQKLEVIHEKVTGEPIKKCKRKYIRSGNFTTKTLNNLP